MTDPNAERSGLYMAHGLPPIVVEGALYVTADTLDNAREDEKLAFFTLATEPGHVYVNPAHVVCVVVARQETDDDRRARTAPRIALA